MGDFMPKFSINVTIKNEEEDNTISTKAILQDSLLKYKENQETVVIYNYDKNSLVRGNNDLRMDYLFDVDRNTEGCIFIKEIGQKIKVKIKTKKLIRKNNNIEIHFVVEGKDFLYKIEEIK